MLIAGGFGAGVYGKTNNGLRALIAMLIVLAICEKLNLASSYALPQSGRSSVL